MPALATSYTISPSTDSTVAIEISRTGLRRHQKHILFFDRFSGEMCFAENDPAAFKMSLTVDSTSAACRDAGLSGKKQRQIGDFTRNVALAADMHPEMRFTASSIRAKEVRGFIVEGVLNIRGITRVVKVSTVMSAARKNCFQLDADATLCLSDFDLPRPSALFGLIGTKDEALLRLLLWAVPPGAGGQA